MTDCGYPTFTLYSTTNIIFPYPEWGSPDNGITKIIDLINFWSGDITTTDKGINNQSLTLGGTLYQCGNWEGLCFPLCFPLCFNSALTCWLNKIEDTMNSGEEFTINELGDALNGVYIIKNFTLNSIPKTVNGYKWKLSLERIRDI